MLALADETAPDVESAPTVAVPEVLNEAAEI